ncbi:MAG: FAD binding domain-containing protein, partial [Anaerolineales bacterium]
LEIQQGRHPPANTLVDITTIPDLKHLEATSEYLWIGSAVPLAQLIAWHPLRQHCQALYEAINLIGGPQVRNVATLGGNVAHALPAADGAIALLALDATVWIAAPQSEQKNGKGLMMETAPPDLPIHPPRVQLRNQPLLDCYAAPGKSTLSSGEIIVAFQIPVKREGESSAFRRVMRPQGVAIAIQNMAVWLHQEKGTIVDIRIALGPAGPKPLRAHLAEEKLRGQRLSQVNLSEASAAILTEARFRTSPHRATAEYRQHLTGILLNETLNQAGLGTGSQ